MTIDTPSALSELETAAAEGKISAKAVENLRVWLAEPRYADYAPLVAEHIREAKWQILDDVFWRVIPFGTGGRRGKMYPIGTNAINDRTIGESAQGFADYVKEHAEADRPLGCAIAYDTRHRSRQFAELCAEIMVAAGLKVYFLDGYRSTPALSFAVRFKQCACGIMVTASHNPPSDNAVKVYWSTGGQILPPHDQGVIDRVMQVVDIHRTPFDEAVASGAIEFCQDEVDRAFISAVSKQAIAGPRDLKIVYTPLHGVGASAVCPVLERDGFTDVEVFGPHAEPSGDFPNVPGHVSNPENSEVFDAPIERAREIGADVVLATDPDCDRLGCAAPRTTAAGAEWATLTGNQVGALLTDFLLGARQAAGTLSPEDYVVKTLVTTELMRRIADRYGVKTFGNLHVGFKWIGGVIDDEGPEGFVLGAEESLGYLAGTYARDKDASVAAMLLAELAARLKADGQTLHQRLDALFAEYGCHAEKTISVTMPGEEGMQRTEALMGRFREQPPEKLAGLPVAAVRDYLNLTVTARGEAPQKLAAPRGDMVVLDLAAPDTSIAVRPSGTEPKVKFYMFVYESPEESTDLAATKQRLDERMQRLAEDLSAFAEA